MRGDKGGEARLLEKISIGFGGHINPIDEKTSSRKCMREIYYNALFREINEEVEVSSKFEDHIVGLINDDSNAVGRVHIGIVHHWSLENQRVDARERGIAQLKFRPITEMASLRGKMETWSQICYMHLNEML
jgi:predicted NUDIX family phosphoesterase